MIRILSIVIFTLISLTVFSQSDMIITLQGDTLTGKVTIISNRNKAQEITLKKDKEKSRFMAYEVESVIKDDKLYHPFKIENLYQLGLLQKEGYLSWYKFMDREETASSEFSQSILIKKDGQKVVVSNLGFKKHVANFLIDCDIVSKKFAEGTYKRSDLEEIIDDYNQCINENTEKLETGISQIDHSAVKSRDIDILITSIEKDGSLPNFENVIDMLNDLSKKYKEGSKIPAYLISSLRTSLETKEEFTKQLNQILE